PESARDAAPPTAGADAEAGADRVVVAVPVDVGPLGLFGGAFARYKEWAVELVYDKLLAPSPYVADSQPWLAESVTQIDPLTWEVTVRDDVTWHDGEPFDADDVAFTIEYYKAAGATGRYTHHVLQVPEVASVEVSDERTVRFTCAYPCPELGPVTLADLPIIPEHIWADITEPSQHSALPVGTGPYRLVEYDPTTGYRFEANADYFAGAPVVDELVMPVIEEPSTAFTALQTGEIDATAHNVPPELLDQLRANPDLQVATTAPLQFTELVLKVEHPLFNVHEVRRAVSLAIDRQMLLGTVLLGQGRAATQGYPHPDSPWTNPDLQTPYEPDQARALLDGLDYRDTDGDGVRETPDGAPLQFDITVAGTEPTHLRATQLVAEQLAAVGMAASIRQLDPASVSALITNRDFDAMVRSISAHGVADPTQFIQSHLSEVGYLWKQGLPYPEWEALFERWRAAETLDARTEIAFEMQELLNRQPPAIPLYYPDEHWAFRPDAFAGWVESPSFGVIHKWALLPRDVARDANAIVEE
ncbi:MAG: ABC transporter substrate-binding protein, partial [Egibacteraceae bacterium]